MSGFFGARLVEETYEGWRKFGCVPGSGRLYPLILPIFLVILLDRVAAQFLSAAIPQRTHFRAPQPFANANHGARSIPARSALMSSQALGRLSMATRLHLSPGPPKCLDESP